MEFYVRIRVINTIHWDCYVLRFANFGYLNVVQINVRFISHRQIVNSAMKNAL